MSSEPIALARRAPPAPTGDPVRVLCSHDVSLPASALSDAAVAELRRALTKPNPEYVEAERMRRRLYGIPHELCFLREGQNLRLPRGAVGILRAVAVRHGYRLDIRSGMTWSPDAKLLPADAPRVPGRPYQIEAEDRLLGIHPGCPGVQGGVVLPCGGGKTLLGARAITRSGQSGIVLVHTVDLLEQWSQTIARVTGREARVVRNGKGLGPLYPWQTAVAMVQGLRKAGADAAPLLRSAGVILCDEAHHLPAETFYDVVSHCPARYRWWLSATPEREDGLGFVLPWVMGPVLLRRTPEELAADGYLVLPRVVPVRTGWSPDPYAHYSGHESGGEPRLDWPATSRGIAEDEARNALICRVAAAAARGGRATLVLVQLVEHAERIASQLASQGVRAVPVTGDVAKGHRRKRLEDLRSGRAEVVVATSLADEGLDIPRLSCVVLAAPQRTRGRSQQRIGRLTRPHGDKTAGLAIDLVDGGPMAAQWRRRARAYEDAVGYPPEPFASVEAVESLLAAARGAF